MTIDLDGGETAVHPAVRRTTVTAAVAPGDFDGEYATVTLGSPITPETGAELHAYISPADGAVVVDVDTRSATDLRININNGLDDAVTFSGGVLQDDWLLRELRRFAGGAVVGDAQLDPAGRDALAAFLAHFAPAPEES